MDAPAWRRITHYGLAALPPHHKDPFDRLIITQGIAEGLTVVSMDGKFAAYPVISFDKALFLLQK